MYIGQSFFYTIQKLPLNPYYKIENFNNFNKKTASLFQEITVETDNLEFQLQAWKIWLQTDEVPSAQTNLLALGFLSNK